MNITEKILIIVPAYNEEEAISSTLYSLLGLQHCFRQLHIVVINDGSTDKTAEIVKSFKEVTLLSLPFNLGIGAAMQLGYKYADEHNFDIAIQFDADGQHNCDDIEHLIVPILEQRSDFCIGSRFLKENNYKSKLGRRIGIHFFALLLTWLTKTRFTDPTSGFRAANKKVIQIFANYYPKDYPEPEVLITLHRKRLLLTEIPVHMRERQGGSSSITPLKSIYYMLKVTLAICMQKLSKV